MIYLDHSPKLQSELQVVIENQNSNGEQRHLHLRCTVVRIEPGLENNRTGIGVVFTE